MTDLSPAAQSFIGPGVIGVLALVVWLGPQGWRAWRAWKESNRKDTKEEKADEYDLRERAVEVEKKETEADRSLAELKDALWKEQYEIVKRMYQAEFAESKRREGEYLTQISELRAEGKSRDARLDLIERQHSQCQAENIVHLAHKRMMLRALKEKGIDLGLDFMIDPPHADPTNVVTVNVGANTEVKTP